MSKFFCIVSFAILIFSGNVFASQQLGRLLISYGSPIHYDAEASGALKDLPIEVRRGIKDFSAYKAGKDGDISILEISSIQLGAGDPVSRDGFMFAVNYLINRPGVSNLKYDFVDTNTSGYPSVRVKYKGKYNGANLGGEILYAYDVSSNSAWIVVVFYSWESGFFSSYRNAAEQAESVINSVGII